MDVNINTWINPIRRMRDKEGEGEKGDGERKGYSPIRYSPQYKSRLKKRRKKKITTPKKNRERNADILSFSHTDSYAGMVRESVSTHDVICKFNLKQNFN